MNSLPVRIRMLRRRQRRTLKDVADVCGFTVSLLSKIESGKTSPPLATLAKIARALGASLGHLLDDGGEAGTVMTPAAGKNAPAARTDKGYGFHVLSGARSRKIMQPLLFVAKRGQVKPGMMSHSGEEFVYVLSGRMRYQVGAVTHTLGPGDSIYFDAEESHDLEPLTPEVQFLAIFAEAPPSRGRIKTASKKSNA